MIKMHKIPGENGVSFYDTEREILVRDLGDGDVYFTQDKNKIGQVKKAVETHGKEIPLSPESKEFIDCFYHMILKPFSKA